MALFRRMFHSRVSFFTHSKAYDRDKNFVALHFAHCQSGSGPQWFIGWVKTWNVFQALTGFSVSGGGAGKEALRPAQTLKIYNFKTIKVFATKLGDTSYKSSRNILALVLRNRQIWRFHSNQFLTAMFSKIRILIFINMISMVYGVINCLSSLILNDAVLWRFSGCRKPLFSFFSKSYYFATGDQILGYCFKKKKSGNFKKARRNYSRLFWVFCSLVQNTYTWNTIHVSRNQNSASIERLFGFISFILIPE